MKQQNKPLSEYPRPQFVRDSYLSLNGYWDYKITKSRDIPKEYDGKILVPFSPETPMSGVCKFVSPNDYLFYHLKFELDKNFVKDIVLLHFTAVDQYAEVFLNDELIITHMGGYLPFSVDIKPYLKEENHLVVRVRDVSDTSYHSRGKQKIKRGGIWYTPQSGIYLPVWLESVKEGYIEDVKMTPDIDNSLLTVNIKSSHPKAKIHIFGREIMVDANKDYQLKIEELHLWSPENPYLYPVFFSNDVDVVGSYFAMRKYSLIKDENGILRLGLNNKPYFMKGVLDQGYYQYSSLTPRSDEDYIKDITTMKELGFNTLRKHIKIESLRWYAHCDRIGMIVWQDFVSGGETYSLKTISFPLISGIHHKDTNHRYFNRNNEAGRIEAYNEFVDTINYLYNVPSIGLWTIFNEGWGQFDSEKIYNSLKEIDSTRLYDHASGWHDQGISDVKSLHVYFKRVKMPNKKKVKNRSIILSECGGYHLKIDGHTFSNKTFGYKKLKDQEALEKEYEKFINLDILPNINKGLSAFIYTELSDVEDELNGFITYDRDIVKVDKNKIKAINDLVKL